MSIAEAIEDKSFYLKSVDGHIFLDPNHKYYHQIQGQQYLSGYNVCDLLVWTQVNCVIIRIGKEKSWEENLMKLMNFYKQVFVHWAKHRL